MYSFMKIYNFIKASLKQVGLLKTRNTHQIECVATESRHVHIVAKRRYNLPFFWEIGVYYL